MKFNASISGFNVDAKKHIVKIALTITSHVQLDELSAIAARDSVSVTLDPGPEITVTSFGTAEPSEKEEAPVESKEDPWIHEMPETSKEPIESKEGTSDD